MSRKRRIVSVILSQLLVLSAFPLTAQTAFAADQTTLTFSNSEIKETVSGSGYSISGTTLTISSSGVYKIKGSCSEGNITVAKNVSDAVLIFDDLKLTASETAPVVVKKGSNVTIHLDGTSTLTDNEDASTEDTNEDFEGAAIKVKSGSSVTFCGEGTLNVYGNAKNGIKGAAESSQTFNGGSFNVNAVNSGIAADGSIVINDGTFNIDVDNDGIKSVPEETDTESAGTVTINGGTLNITADGDAVQAESKLAITNGNFNIKTLGGYNDSSFNSSTMSCKGLKASGDREDVENNIVITGGTFNLNTADDAVHSDTNASITGGTFYIYTGDDGVHADTLLNLGEENAFARDPEFYIYSSYEGLEAGTVNVYSGKYWVVASDDGINAAGGSSNGTDPGMGGGNTFNPWGGGFGGGGRPGGGNGGNGGGTASGNYSLNIYGGNIYVDAQGDGLDSNGALNLYGGTQTVFSQAQGGDNSPLDSDGTLLISGATVFAAGTNPMNETPSSSSQSYYSQTTGYSAGTVVTLKNGNTTLYSDKLLRNTNYLLYSTPNVSSSSVSLTTGGSVDTCNSNAWAHNWNNGTVTVKATETTTGKMTYTCQDCGETEYKTIPATGSYNCDGHTSSSQETDEGYNVTFNTGSGASVNVYYTQDYSTASETNVKSTVSRNSDTGSPDSTGDGQVNFTVALSDGYELDSVTVSGDYKNLKDVSTDTLPNTYRVTKISGDLTITVTTKQTETTTKLVNNSTISATSINLGDSLKLTGAATGGTGSYTYAVYYKQSSQTTWTAAQSTYASTITSTITPKAATTYNVRVKVKDSEGTIANKDFTVTVKKALVNNSTISATSINLGDSLTLKGAATGGTSPYTYAVFYKQNSQTTWTTVQTYASSITKTITPKAATTYTVRVKVKDSAGTITNKDFTVTVTKALANNSTISATSISLGNSVTLKGSSTGGTGTKQYIYYYKLSTASAWTTLKGYSTATSATLTPTKAGTYDICIKVKDENGTIVKKYFTLTVK